MIIIADMRGKYYGHQNGKMCYAVSHMHVSVIKYKLILKQTKNKISPIYTPSWWWQF